MRKVMRFGIPVAVGKFISAMSGVLILALLARQLGPGPLGTIALIRTVVTVVDSYASFNTWQAVIKYGTEAMAKERPRDIELVIKVAFVMDAVTAMVGTLVIVGLAFVLPPVFDWHSDESRLCIIYSFTILTHIQGAPDGIFRIFDAYRAQARVGIVGSLFMIASVATAIAFDASTEGCVLALVVGEVAANILVVITSIWVANKRGYRDWVRADLRGWRSRFDGIGRFLVSTNAQVTVKKTVAELDMFVVGAMLGNVASGLLRVVKQLGTIPGRIFMPFEQVLFTELARLAAVDDHAAFRQLLRRSVMMFTFGSLAIWLGATLLAEPLVRIVAGDEFIGAAPALVWYLLAIVLTVASAPILRALIVLGRPGTLFFFELASVGLLAVAAILGALWYGLVGVCVAFLLQRGVQFVWSAWVVNKTLHERQSLAGAVAMTSEAAD